MSTAYCRKKNPSLRGETREVVVDVTDSKQACSYKGARFDDAAQKGGAQTSVSDKRDTLGNHATEIDAAEGYDKGVRHLPKTSLYRGVTFNKVSRKWQAAARMGEKILPLGSHVIEIDAAKAYDEGVHRCHNKILNFPDDYPLRYGVLLPTISHDAYIENDKEQHVTPIPRGQEERHGVGLKKRFGTSRRPLEVPGQESVTSVVDTEEEVALEYDRLVHGRTKRPLSTPIKAEEVASWGESGGQDRFKKYAGVSFNKASQKWTAQTSIGGKRLYLGCYATEVEAGKAYDKTAHHLPDRTLNFPEDYPIRCGDDADVTEGGDKRHTSTYRGVSQHGRKWAARATFDVKIVYLGSYATEVEAAKAYDKAVHHLPDRRLNFPEDYGRCGGSVRFDEGDETRQGEVKKKKKKKTSRYTGVSFNKRSQKWRAQTTHDGKKLHFGAFTTEFEAAKAYDKAVHHLPDKKINFPEDYGRCGDSDEGDETRQGEVKDMSSTYTGVCFNTARQKWRAQTNLNGKKPYFGSYITEVEAAKAHDKAVHHLPDKKLNFPEDYGRCGDSSRFDEGGETRQGEGKKKKTEKEASTYTGVSFDNAKQRWAAHATINGKQYYLGSYATEVEAAKAFDKAVLHLPDRKLNFLSISARSVRVDDGEDATQQGEVKKKSMYRGVYLHRKKWMAQTTLDGKMTYLGSYATEVEAAKIYDKAVLHLTNRKLNFPEDYLSRRCDGVRVHDGEGKKKKTIMIMYTGVSFNKANQKWTAQTTFGAKKAHLGSHATEFEAAKAYDKAVYHLPDRKLNFPEDYPERISLEPIPCSSKMPLLPPPPPPLSKTYTGVKKGDVVNDMDSGDRIDGGLHLGKFKRRREEEAQEESEEDFDKIGYKEAAFGGDSDCMEDQPKKNEKPWHPNIGNRVKFVRNERHPSPSFSVSSPSSSASSSSSSSSSSSLPAASTAGGGGPSSVPLFAVGGRVEALYDGGEDWYPGVVSACHAGAKTFDVDYDDGDHECKVPAAMLRRVGEGGGGRSGISSVGSSVSKKKERGNGSGGDNSDDEATQGFPLPVPRGFRIAGQDSHGVWFFEKDDGDKNKETHNICISATLAQGILVDEVDYDEVDGYGIFACAD